jgi:hypothetical protein
MLEKDVWYLVSTAANIGEPLFDLPWTRILFSSVLHDAKGVFSFEIRGIKMEGAVLSFYIMPSIAQLLPLLGKDYERICIELGIIRRAREIKTPN